MLFAVQHGESLVTAIFQKVKIISYTLRSAVALFSPGRFSHNPNGLDISLTSYGFRIAIVGFAISSFCLRSKSIRNIYLTIDSEEEISAIKSFFLRLLKAKGVRVIRGPRRGPHSKYWYYLHTYWDGDRAFMLIDDDVIYEPGIADLLSNSAKDAPFNVCVRALRFEVASGRVNPYRAWPLYTTCGTSSSIFATNVGGVVIKPIFAQKLIELGEQYQTCCKNADDVWFHWVSVRYDMPYTLATPDFRNPTPIPLSQGNALSTGVNLMGNDTSIRGIYSSEDVRALEK